MQAFVDEGFEPMASLARSKREFGEFGGNGPTSQILWFTLKGVALTSISQRKFFPFTSAYLTHIEDFEFPAGVNASIESSTTFTGAPLVDFSQINLRLV